MGYNRCPLFIILTKHGFCAVSVIKINPKRNSQNWSSRSLIDLKLCLLQQSSLAQNYDQKLVISRSLSGDPLNSYFSLINMAIHPRSYLVSSFNLESHLAIPLLITNTKKCVCGLIMMGDLPGWKREKVVSFLWVTYPGKIWSHCDGWPTQRKRKSGLILWVTYPGEGMASFLWMTYPGKKNREWSHSFRWPTQKKYGLIVMGDLPKWTKEEWSHSLGDLPRGRNGLILMGDLPR